jgi:hypothetical protein
VRFLPKCCAVGTLLLVEEENFVGVNFALQEWDFGIKLFEKVQKNSLKHPNRNIIFKTKIRTRNLFLTLTNSLNI